MPWHHPNQIDRYLCLSNALSVPGRLRVVEWWWWSDARDGEFSRADARSDRLGLGGEGGKKDCLVLSLGWRVGFWVGGALCGGSPRDALRYYEFRNNWNQNRVGPKKPRNCSKYLDWDFCQFFVVLHKIRHDCIMKLHGPSPQITKKTKHGNLYNDRSTLKSWKMLKNR